MKQIRLTLVFLVIGVAVVASGCAGVGQHVIRIRSFPSNAKVEVFDTEMEAKYTPCELVLRPDRVYRIQLTHEGCEPEEVVLRPSYGPKMLIWGFILTIHVIPAPIGIPLIIFHKRGYHFYYTVGDGKEKDFDDDLDPSDEGYNLIMVQLKEKGEVETETEKEVETETETGR